MRILLVLLVLTSHISAQNFQSVENPYYWKNKIAEKSDYWQQDVDYTIDARLDEKEEIIYGREKIVYTNNSPHTLSHLFFNLYQNAFLKDGYLGNLQKANGLNVKYGKWEREGKGNEIVSMKVDGVTVKTEIDGSLMKVFLKNEVKPNTNIEIEIVFKTHYSKGGNTRRRMKSYTYKGAKHFNGPHWYPRLAVYDRKFGWCTDQHLGREFYGDFGNFRVSLDMPANFVVEATGVLQNKEEVLPDTLRDKLDISNYWTHKWDTAITYHIPIDSGQRKVWKYFAENVHDFAWVAGPHYRLHEKKYKGYSTVALVLEPHCSGWKNACDFSHKVIDVYSRDFGQYAYPKMVVADCQDGMEYPMLTMDGGSDPGYRGLLAHEIGHNWFYGMVNNNETYRAMLDEGFTQFLTAWSLEAIDGKNIFNDPSPNKYIMRHHIPTEVRDRRTYDGYMADAMHHNRTEIDVHSDGFNGAVRHGGGYRHVYYKTATMLYAMQYVLGDTLFQNAMKHYFNQWSFRHPYVEDFRNSIIEYTKVDLNWFFDQWISTSKTVDYKIFPLTKIKGNNYRLKLKRRGDMQMPLDISVVGKSGKRYNFYVPNTWFEKETEATILPRWIGWDSKLKTEYETDITIPETPDYAFIDSTRRIADINEMNNTTKFPWRFLFDSKTDKPRNKTTYTVLWRPDIWYNNFDGIKLGAHFEGSYFGSFHRTNLDVWGNTGIGKWAARPRTSYANIDHDIASFSFSYESPINRFIQGTNFRLDLRHIAGVALGQFKFTKTLSKGFEVAFTGKSMLRYRSDQDYYNYFTRMQWNSQQLLNSSAILDISHGSKLSHKIHQNTSLRLRTSALSSADYSYLDLEHAERMSLDKFYLKWKFKGRLGANNASLLPTETLLNAGGASGEEMLESEFMRSVTFFSPYFTPYSESAVATSGFSRLHYGGGLNMRGYSFRELVFDNGAAYSLVNQNSGVVLNLEMNFEKYSPIRFRKLSRYIDMQTYVFADIGSISNFDVNNLRIARSPIISDMGFGTSLSLKQFAFLSGIKPLTFRFDMPLYLSHPAMGDNDEQFKFRWLLGVEKAF